MRQSPAAQSPSLGGMSLPPKYNPQNTPIILLRLYIARNFTAEQEIAFLINCSCL